MKQAFRWMWIGVGTISAVLLLGCGNGPELEQTRQQLTDASNSLVAARTEVVNVKTQMQVKVEELNGTITKMTDQQAESDKRVGSLQADLENQRQKDQAQLKELQAQVDALSLDKTNMSNELKVLGVQLGDLNRQYTDLQKTHATTVQHLQAMRDEYARLNNEKVALEAKMHDPQALKQQMVIVKQEIHQKKIEESKRLDRAEAAMGNHGYFMKDGTEVVEKTPGSYPLNQELYRPE